MAISRLQTVSCHLTFREGTRPAGDAQGLTCPSHAATASQSADAASGPLEPLLSTHRTGCHWCFQGNSGRGRGRWWRYAQRLHKGLGAGSRGGWVVRGGQREGERVSLPPDPHPYSLVGRNRMRRGRRGKGLSSWVGSPC